jgi:hypothetical protein
LQPCTWSGKAVRASLLAAVAVLLCTAVLLRDGGEMKVAEVCRRKITGTADTARNDAAGSTAQLTGF